MKALLLLSFIVAAQCDVCWYYDTVFDRDEYFTCYDSECCGDSCCDDYWDTGDIAGAAVGSIIGFAVFISIMVAVIRICCAANNGGRRGVMLARRDQAAVTIVSNSSSGITSNQVATPYMHYPQPVAPPPYTQAASAGVVNPNFIPQNAPMQKY